MRYAKAFKLGTVIVGVVALAILVTGLNEAPVSWMQATLLKSFGATPSVAQAVPSGPSEQVNAPLQLAARIRPALKQKSAEDLKTEKLPKAVPPGERRRPTKDELLNKCNANPNCRAKLEAIKSKKIKQPRPAATVDPPEEKERKKLPKAGTPTGPQKHPVTGLMLPEESHSLFSWLNPFQVDTAYAHGTVSVYLTPGGPYVSRSYMGFYGGSVNPNSSFYLSTYIAYGSSNNGNKPYAMIRFYAPTTGTYLINVEGSRAKAKMRHQGGGPIINEWDFTAQPYGTFDYLTAEYLAQGYHYFYFWPNGVSLYVYSATVESTF